MLLDGSLDGQKIQARSVKFEESLTLKYSFVLNSVARVIYVLMILGATSARVAEVNSGLPFTSYTKSIDVYTGVNVLFVFMALLGNFRNLWYTMHAVHSIPLKPKPECVIVDYLKRHREGGIRNLKWRNRPDLVDKVSRVAFPAAYALFFLVHFAI